MKKYKLIIFALIILFAIFLFRIFINRSDGQSSISLTQRNQLTRIEIINKTINQNILNKKTITNKEQLNCFVEQYNLLKEVDNVNVKTGFGYFDVFLYFEDGRNLNIHISQTLYYGIVIHNPKTNRYFKNNSMEDLMITFLKK